jgi:hypothetical protein
MSRKLYIGLVQKLQFLNNSIEEMTGVCFSMIKLLERCVKREAR